MNEQPPCKLCGSEASTKNPYYGTQYVDTALCPNPRCCLFNVGLSLDDWRTLHDQSHCAELEAKLEAIENNSALIAELGRLEKQNARQQERIGGFGAAIESMLARCAENYCRPCTGCSDEEHHWIEDIAAESLGGHPVYVCKHCPAVMPIDYPTPQPEGGRNG